MSERCRSVCPHDCPSTCALDVERLNPATIGKVYGAKDHSYTQGVICAKVSRYAERIHHPDRVLNPLAKINGRFEQVSWDQALDTIATRFAAIKAQSGGEASGRFTMRAPWDWCNVTDWIAFVVNTQHPDSIQLIVLPCQMQGIKQGPDASAAAMHG